MMTRRAVLVATAYGRRRGDSGTDGAPHGTLKPESLNDLE